MKARVALLLSAIAIAACTPSTVTPSPDASVSSAACATLEKAGCPLGKNPLCADRVERGISENHTTHEKVACVANAAPTKDAIAACKSPFFACP
jgi:hypothetical protein